MARTFEVTFAVQVTLTIEDDDVIARTQTDDWKDCLYDLDEEEAVEMVARCVGILGSPLSGLDGWADMPNDAVSTHTEFLDYEVRELAAR